MGILDLRKNAERVPLVVKAGIRGLSDDERLGLAMALEKSGRMTFSQMKKKFGLDSATLRGHLFELQAGHLVRNYYEKSEGEIRSYYETTALPCALLGALFTVVREETEQPASLPPGGCRLTSDPVHEQRLPFFPAAGMAEKAVRCTVLDTVSSAARRDPGGPNLASMQSPPGESIPQYARHRSAHMRGVHDE